MINIFSIKPTTLKSPLNSNSTEVILKQFADRHGNLVDFADLETEFFTIILKQADQWEQIKIDNLTQNADGSATLDIATNGRNILPIPPFTGSSTGFDFSLAEVVVGADTLTMSLLANIKNANTWDLRQTFTVAPKSSADAVDSDHLVRLAQLQSAVLGALTSSPVVISGNAGETVAEDKLVYLNSADGEWYLADADVVNNVENVLLGMTRGAGTNGNEITGGITLIGLHQMSGLTANSPYYASNTAGEIGTTTGTTEVIIGFSKSTTDLIFIPRFTQHLTENIQDALENALGGALSLANPVISQGETSSTGSGTKIPKGVGGKIDPSWLNIGLKATLVAGEDLASGNPVYINPSDAKLYKAHGFKELDSTSINITPSISRKISKLSDTQFMVLTNSSGTLTITVYNVNSGSSVATQTVTTGLDTTGNTLNRVGATMARLSDTTFIVFYTKTSNNTLYFRTGSISGGTITMDTETAWTGSPTYCYSLDAMPADANGKVIFSYFASTALPGNSATPVATLVYLTCATNSVTINHSVTYSTSSGTYFASPFYSKVAFSKNIAYGLFNCINSGNVYELRFSAIDIVTGNTVSGLAIPSIEIPSGAGVSNTYGGNLPDLIGHNGNAYFGYSTAVDNTQTMAVYELSPRGSSLVYQQTTVGAGVSGTYALKLFGNEMGVIVAGLSESYAPNCIYIQKDKIYKFSDTNTLGISSVGTSSNYSNSKDEIVVAYVGSSGVVKQWKLPTLMDGFVTGAVVAPASGNLASIGTTSGLTTGSKYYLKDTYTNAGEIDAIGIIPVGDALSTTSIINN